MIWKTCSQAIMPQLLELGQGVPKENENKKTPRKFLRFSLDSSLVRGEWSPSSFYAERCILSGSRQFCAFH